MNKDYTMMHERVAYRMYREAGVPLRAPITRSST